MKKHDFLKEGGCMEIASKKKQLETQKEWLLKRLDTLLPKLMTETGIFLEQTVGFDGEKIIFFDDRQKEFLIIE